MAKDKSASKEERRKIKAEKKRSEESGVHKSAPGKGKKEKKAKREALAEKALNEVSKDDKEHKDEGEVVDVMEVEEKKLSLKPAGALVPFANPLTDEKVAKKVFKGVKKAASHKSLKRGVKEVVKALRKSPPSSATSSTPSSVVILAADISPMDVISHIPVLCEDHNIPYVYVTSRAELGIAGQTKRPTSVVMVTASAQGKKKEAGGEEEEKEWTEVFAGLVKTIEREGMHVKI